MKTKAVLIYYGLFFIFCVVVYNASYYWERWTHWQSDLLLDSYRRDENAEFFNDDDNFDDTKFSSNRCRLPINNIAFVKTHKTGSSTITSILNRFADINDQQIAIPNEPNRFHWPYPFRLKYVDRTRLETKHASVLSNHLVFNRKEISRLMNLPYKLITILRNPTFQFRSLFYYHSMHKIYNISHTFDPMETFFKNTSRFYGKISTDQFVYHSEILMRNGMSFDLNLGGFQNLPFNNSFEDFIEYIDKSFHLVLITELFDEGLILLKRLMCWKFIDIVYEKKLVNNNIKHSKIPSKVQESIHEWNKFDLHLYKHFKLKMLALIKEQEQIQFQNDLKTFKKFNKLVNNFCIQRSLFNYQQVVKNLSLLGLTESQEFSLKPHCFCNKLFRSEVQYLTYFRKKFPKFYFMDNLAFLKKGHDGC